MKRALLRQLCRLLCRLLEPFPLLRKGKVQGSQPPSYGSYDTCPAAAGVWSPAACGWSPTTTRKEDEQGRRYTVIGGGWNRSCRGHEQHVY